MKILTLLFLMALPAFGGVTVAFSPAGGCEYAVCRAINASTGSVRCAIYTMTNMRIVTSFCARARAGVDVQIIVDNKEATTYAPMAAAVSNLVAAGVAVYRDAKHPIMHDKYLVADGCEVVTGSFNYTATAEHANAENVVVISDPKVAAAYLKDWLWHSSHSAKAGATP